MLNLCLQFHSKFQKDTGVDPGFLGVHMYKCVGVSFADLISFFLKIP